MTQSEKFELLEGISSVDRCELGKILAAWSALSPLGKTVAVPWIEELIDDHLTVASEPVHDESWAQGVLEGAALECQLRQAKERRDEH